MVSLFSSIGFSKGWKEAFTSGDQEPWVFRGGLTADLQRLMPVDSGNDLFVYKLPEQPTANYYQLRPYRNTDEQQVYQICTSTYMQWQSKDDGDDILLPAQLADIAADCIVGAHVTLHPEFCIVAYDNSDNIVGYACGALDVSIFQRNMDICWLPELREKYRKELLENETGDGNGKSQKLLTHFKELIHGGNSASLVCPIEVSGSFPAVLSAATLREAEQRDSGIAKRLLTVLLAALRANGCFGVHVCLSDEDAEQLCFYTKIGFIEVYRNEVNKCIYLGRRF